jgi:hypothetical protein
MTEFVVHWIDVGPYLRSGQQPVFLLQRPDHGTDRRTYGFVAADVARLGEFWVPQGPVLDGFEWGVTRSGDMVRVPVHAYRTKQRALAAVWGLGLQVGMVALGDLVRRGLGMPKSVTLVLGHECTDLAPADDAFRCYAGMAFQVR